MTGLLRSKIDGKSSVSCAEFIKIGVLTSSLDQCFSNLRARESLGDLVRLQTLFLEVWGGARAPDSLPGDAAAAGP